MNETFIKQASQNKCATEEEFRIFIKENLESQRTNLIDHFLDHDIQDALKTKIHINLPTEYITKRFEAEFSKNKDQSENVDKEKLKTNFETQTKLSLLYQEVMKKADIKITESDIVEKAYSYVYNYIINYFPSADREFIEKQVTEMLKSKETVQQLHNMVVRDKVTEHFMQTHEFKLKEISFEELRKLESEHKHE